MGWTMGLEPTTAGITIRLTFPNSTALQTHSCLILVHKTTFQASLYCTTARKYFLEDEFNSL